ncbi:hypothetical protein, conserved [Trypanosoma brucei gambiense DAL972]|uniref:Uncharacterized protein n=1 Tax=Trypanosoma brucei gambiense (strain MHOM/CI/86/DAL972) TaxID=679716 RepID=D0A7U3_TRYB9|nr:hypothetical protein, conserved [Trypanosoma brucei gambiense DAL972]CBH17744.1 hypothetical protein, conserved [Trypanosoma brucei gambiense DAL972]|eukprot:XP_011780008.1 hypothetical protein, conserved [Trypanosoma brucei gambiense DAL972]
MTPPTTRRYPIRLLVRHLPHDTTAESITRIIVEGCPTDSVEEVTTVYVIPGRPQQGVLPPIPSTAVVTIQPTARQQADSNLAMCDRALEIVADTFDGKVVHSGDAGTCNVMESTVELSPVCLRIPSGMRSKRGVSEDWVNRLRSISAGSIEDDDNYRAFCVSALGSNREVLTAGNNMSKGWMHEGGNTADGATTHQVGAAATSLREQHQQGSQEGEGKQISNLVKYLVSGVDQRKKKGSSCRRKNEKKAGAPANAKPMKILVREWTEDDAGKLTSVGQTGAGLQRREVSSGTTKTPPREGGGQGESGGGKRRKRSRQSKKKAAKLDDLDGHRNTDGVSGTLEGRKGKGLKLPKRTAELDNHSDESAVNDKGCRDAEKRANRRKKRRADRKRRNRRSKEKEGETLTAAGAE